MSLRLLLKPADTTGAAAVLPSPPALERECSTPDILILRVIMNVTRFIGVTRWAYLAAMRLSMSSDSFPVMADICTSIEPPAYAWVVHNTCNHNQ